MLRRWVALILVVLQLQPAFAFAPGPVGSLVLEIDHALVHQSGQGHHHGDTLAFQISEDGDALAHAHHDAGHHSALPLTVLALKVPLGEPAARVLFLGGRLPDPDLEGLLRPPRISV
jgi:hypothetical protein